MWHVALESCHWIRQVAAPCSVALRWHAIEFAKTSAILEFYIWFWFRPHHRSQHVILHQFPKFYPNRTTLGREKMTSCRFSRWRISAILDFRDPIMGSLKCPCTTFYRSSIENIALNWLVFEKIMFFAFWRQTDRRTDGHRCCEWRVNKVDNITWCQKWSFYSVVLQLTVGDKHYTPWTTMWLYNGGVGRGINVVAVLRRLSTTAISCCHVLWTHCSTTCLRCLAALQNTSCV